MKVSDLMRAMSEAGAPMEAILIAVRAIEERDDAIASKRAAERDRKRRQRAKGKDTDGTVAGQSRDTDGTVTDNPSLSPAPFLSPQTPQTNPHPHTHPDNISRARKAHALPADWEPVLTAKAQQTVDGWPPGQLERELAAFRDHAADKGRTSKDWQAAFRTWINNSNRWKPANGNASRNHRTDEQPANPYVRAVLARQSGAVGNGGGQPDCWP